ncbi:MAG: tetratricopeptide repeat protein [Leptolyngbyaceae cyanobacterium SM1_3_5]|nr:tetratricopeptide repeat protein [Leptolyngbyaceae cyanobacterium SM1_3_5]
MASHPPTILKIPHSWGLWRAAPIAKWLIELTFFPFTPVFTKASRPPHQIYYNLGWILQQQEDLEQAADRYRKAIVIGRQSGQAELCADAHHNLGVVLAQQERWLAAAYHYRRSIDLRPTLLAYCNLGTALLQQGETAAAIEIYQQATSFPEQKPAPSRQISITIWRRRGSSSDAWARRSPLTIRPSRSILPEPKFTTTWDAPCISKAILPGRSTASKPRCG